MLARSDVECCGPCHEDEDDGYSHMLDHEIDGEWYVMCCTVAEALSETQP